MSTAANYEFTWCKVTRARTKAAVWNIEFEATTGRWSLSGKGRSADGVLALGELTIRMTKGVSGAPDDGLTTTLLQSLPLGAIRDEIKEMVLSEWAEEGLMPVPGDSRTRLQTRRARNAQRSVGRERLDDDYYFEFAKARIGLGQVATPNVALAQQFGISPEKARDRIRACRERGYLAMSKRGENGALPGPRFLERIGERREKGKR